MCEAQTGECGFGQGTAAYCREMKMEGNTLATGWANAALESSVITFFCAPLNGSDTKWQRY